MLKSKFSIVGIIIVIFAVYMQYRGGAGEWAPMLTASGPKGASGDARPPIASGYIKSDTAAAAQPSSLKPFEDADYKSLLSSIDNLANSLSKKIALCSLNDYRDDCVNIFVPRITSSQELGLNEEELARKNGFNIILNSADISYAGYFNTPSGMNAIIKVRGGGANMVKAGEILANTNLKLKAINERYAVFENMISSMDEKVYITSR